MNDEAIESLEIELDDLPMMAIDLPNSMMILGDAFDIDPLLVVKAMMTFTDDDPIVKDLMEEYGSREVRVMIDLIEEGLDSSTLLPYLHRAIEIIQGLNELR